MGFPVIVNLHIWMFVSNKDGCGLTAGMRDLVIPFEKKESFQFRGANVIPVGWSIPNISFNFKTAINNKIRRRIPPTCGCTANYDRGYCKTNHRLE